jgi:hypothetical protein
MEIWTSFSCYNRVLFVLTGKIYHKNDLNQPKYFFVCYNRVFIITELDYSIHHNGGGGILKNVTHLGDVILEDE